MTQLKPIKLSPLLLLAVANVCTLKYSTATTSFISLRTFIATCACLDTLTEAKRTPHDSGLLNDVLAILLEASVNEVVTPEISAEIYALIDRLITMYDCILPEEVTPT